jgi:two-component system, cell cycle sensor histidine kinase and response regulator CckA
VIENPSIQVLGALAGGIAHEFNEELTVILNSLEGAARHLDANHPAVRDLKQLRMAARRCLHTTESLLAFTSRVDPQIRPFHLAAFFEAAERVLPY